MRGMRPAAAQPSANITPTTISVSRWGVKSEAVGAARNAMLTALKGTTVLLAPHSQPKEPLQITWSNLTSAGVLNHRTQCTGMLMCFRCNAPSTASSSSLSRRRLLTFAGAGALTLAATGSGIAAPPKAPPKPENVISADEAIKRLQEGNTRYIQGVTRRHDFKNEREKLAGGQNPFAAILGCADSRIAPELAFDTSRGDLFVCRVAGNITNADTIASFEYAIAVLHTPLIMVLGHGSCGAVDAAIKSIKDNTTLPGHLPSLVEAIAPAVKAVPSWSLDDTIKQNVAINVERLKSATPIIAKAIEDKQIRIIGGVYNLATGRVDLTV
jgi:carbonic anhydrase